MRVFIGVMLILLFRRQRAKSVNQGRRKSSTQVPVWQHPNGTATSVDSSKAPSGVSSPPLSGSPRLQTVAVEAQDPHHMQVQSVTALPELMPTAGTSVQESDQSIDKLPV